MCLGAGCQALATRQMVYIPPGVFHQLTNIGDTSLHMIYTYVVLEGAKGVQLAEKAPKAWSRLKA